MIKIGKYVLGPGFIVLLALVGLGLLYVGLGQIGVDPLSYLRTKSDTANTAKNNEFGTTSTSSTTESNPGSNNKAGYVVNVPKFSGKNRGSLPPQTKPLMANKECMGGAVLVKRWLFSFSFETDGVNHNMLETKVTPHQLDLGKPESSDAFIRVINGAIRGVMTKCPNTEWQKKLGNVQFVVNSTASKLPAVELARQQLKSQLVVNESELSSEGKNALLSAVMDSYKYNSFVFDLTSEFVRISWYDKNGNPQTIKLEVGYDFYTKQTDLGEVTQKVRTALSMVPVENRQNCFAIWTVLKNMRSADNRQYVYLGEVQDFNISPVEDEQTMIKSGLFLLNTAQLQLDNEIIMSFGDHYFVGFSNQILNSRK